MTHSSIYRHLWLNAPKEFCLEYADYTHDEHWGRAVPAYLPFEAVKDYMNGMLTL